MSATMTFSIPGSNSGKSVPGIFGPPGTTPTQSSPPASSARYQVSPSEVSDTAGASGLGGPKSTRCSTTASAIAVRARPTATAKAPTGWVLNAPKNVISLDVNVAISGTPSTPSAASTVSQASLGIRGARPLSTATDLVWARSDTVANADAMK